MFLYIVIAFGASYLIYLWLIFQTVDKPTFENRYLISFLAFFIWIVSGYVLAHLKDVKNDPDHLLYKEEVEAYMGIVQGVDETKPRSVRNIVKVSSVRKEGKWEEAKGNVIIYHQSALAPGQIAVFKGKPERVAAPLNPNEFNYAKFLSRQQIFHTHFVGRNVEVVGRVNEQHLHFFFTSLRKYIQEQMDIRITNHKANQIAKALLLGQKNTLDKEVSEAYSTAGAMHILAVSGLHVGIIYGVFLLFVRPFRLKIHKRVAYLSVVILTIWVYAFLTGMSPSVMRSATMFTIFSLAQMKARNPSIFNGLALSAVLLLLYDPFLIYAVGFQLSYAALTGILLFQPLIVNLWLPRNKIVNYCWEITAVGIAAQLGTFPVSAYYFHSFPSYFILSNLIAIPGAFLIMAVGIPFMMFSFIAPVASALGTVLDYAVQLVNSGIFFIQTLPSAKISSISIELWEIGWYYLLLMLVYWLIMKPYKRLVIAIMGVLFLGTIVHWKTFIRQLDRHEIYLYTLQSGRAIDYLQGKSMFTWNSNTPQEDIEYRVLPNRVKLGIKASEPIPIRHLPDQGAFFLPHQKIISIDGQKLIFDNINIKEVAKYENSKWVICSGAEIQWNDKTAYRIILE